MLLGTLKCTRGATIQSLHRLVSEKIIATIIQTLKSNFKNRINLVCTRLKTKVPENQFYAQKQTVIFCFLICSLWLKIVMLYSQI